MELRSLVHKSSCRLQMPRQIPLVARGGACVPQWRLVAGRVVLVRLAVVIAVALGPQPPPRRSHNLQRAPPSPAPPNLHHICSCRTAHSLTLSNRIAPSRRRGLTLAQRHLPPAVV